MNPGALPPQGPKILALLRARGELTTMEIWQLLRMPHTTACRTLKHLRARGLVLRRRVVDTDDPHTTWTLWRLNPLGRASVK